MLNSNFRRMTWGIIVWSLLGFSICFASETTGGKPDAAPSAAAQTVSGEDAGTKRDEEPGEAPMSRGLMSGLANQIHEIMEDERIKTMSEIDNQRLETLAELTRERLALTDDLLSERAKAFVELEDMINRISEQTITSSKQLIDYFFIRLVQFAIGVFLLAGLLGFFLFRRKGGPKNDTGVRTQVGS